MQELKHLSTSIDYIRSVVAPQQSSAGKRSSIEPVQICDLLANALRVNHGVLTRLGVSVVGQFAEMPCSRLSGLSRCKSW